MMVDSVITFDYITYHKKRQTQLLYFCWLEQLQLSVQKYMKECTLYLCVEVVI